MKIAVNTRLLLPNKLEGIGRVSYEVLKRITSKHPEHEFYFLFDRTYSDEFIFNSNIIPISVFPQARHPFLFIAWFDFSLPRVFKKIKPDIFFSPDGYLSLNTKVPSINIIHDLNFEHYPKHLPFLSRNHYRHYFPRFAKKAKRIITVSEFTKNDVIKQYNISPNKIDVAHNGVSDIFVPCSQTEIHETKKRFTQGKPYFLFVGSLHPRKNIGNLMLAYDEFRKSTSADIKLVIAGQAYWWNKEMESVYKSVKHNYDIIFTGRIDNETLKNLYGSAFAVTYVSLFEGFGLPILEAMNCDVPVICSNNSSMPEVGGDAVVYVNAKSPESINKGMKEVFNNKSLREELINKGRIQKNNFSWDKSAENIWNTLTKAL